MVDETTRASLALCVTAFQDGLSTALALANISFVHEPLKITFLTKVVSKSMQLSHSALMKAVVMHHFEAGSGKTQMTGQEFHKKCAILIWALCVCEGEDLYHTIAHIYARRSSTISRSQCAQLFEDMFNMTGTGKQHRTMSHNIFASFLDYVQSVSEASTPPSAGSLKTAELDEHCTSPVSVADFIPTHVASLGPPAVPPTLASRATPARRGLLHLNLAPLKISRRAASKPVEEQVEETFDIDLLVRFCKLRRAQMWPLHTIQNQLRARFIGPGYWEGAKRQITFSALRCRAAMEEMELFAMLEDTMDPRKSRTSPRSSPLNKIFSRLSHAARSRIK